MEEMEEEDLDEKCEGELGEGRDGDVHRRRPGAEFGGTGKTFADQDFQMTFFNAQNF